MKKIINIFIWVLAIVLNTRAQCINMTNLNDPSITCTYGTVENPYANNGVIDYGSSSGNSRHTIHVSTIERDYIIPDLYTVPRGETSSIRLGNWSIGGEAESITFQYTVSAENPLLLLKYAGVMENPGHSSLEQPRLKLDVMDESGTLIDSLCNCFDFIAASNLGWNSYYGILWKDWTNIGVNLISYIGRTVRIRLTSYDCSQMGHFGYSYIHLSCVQQEIQNTSCGEDVVLEAPLGYEYKWYTISGGIEKVLSSNREIVVPKDGTLYYCNCSQVGKPLCYFTISKIASATPRYPLADFLINKRLGCADTLYITNTSGISVDGIEKNIPIEPCDSAVWILDDGRQFTQYDISSIPIVFSTTGKHTITLTTFLTKGGCHSTKSQDIYVHGTTDPHSSSISAEICEGGYYYYSGIRLTKDSTYTFIHETSYNCDSIVKLRLIVHPQYLEKDTIYLCDGESIDYHGQKISSNGTYYANFKSIYGCDSIYKAIVYRKNSFFIEKDTTICQGEIYDFGGRLLQVPGIYWDSARTIFGCDSITKLTLHVNPTYTIPTYAEICHDQSFWFRGRELNAPGIYYDSLLTHMGCDSVFKLVLNHTPIYLIQDTVTICEGSYYDFRGKLVSEAGMYYDSLSTINGCDSVYQLLLQVKPLSMQKIDTIICGGIYNFRGRPLTQSGVYFDTVRTFYGCDSVFKLDLTINPTYLFKDYVEQCEGDAFYFRNKIIESPGVYYDSLLTIEGCDSVYMLTYNITPTYMQQFEDTICSNKKYQFRGMELTRPGIYIDTLQTVSGCDSLFKLTLYHHDSYLFEMKDTIACSNSVLLHGKEITQSGIYTDSLQTTCGCDSIYKYNITLYNEYLFEENVRICDHSPYNFRGRILSESGIYEDSLVTINGCDSIYRVILDVTPTLRDTLVDTVCLGYTYPFAGMLLKEAGFYSDTLSDPMGKRCVINNLQLGTKTPPVITQLAIPQICADDEKYELQFHYYGTKPYTYTIYYDENAKRNGFVDIIDEDFDDTIFIPIPQYHGRDYLRPDIYSAKVQVNNGFCSPDSTTYHFNLLIRYPSWIIRQHWNDVVATLNDKYNGGYFFTSYIWEVNGRILTTTDSNYSNLYMPELRYGDDVCVYLTRKGENYAIPSCPITIQDMSSQIQSTYPIIVQPTYLSKRNAMTNIFAKEEGTYELINVHGEVVRQKTEYITGVNAIQIPSNEGLYFIRLSNKQGETYTFKIMVY